MFFVILAHWETSGRHRGGWPSMPMPVQAVCIPLEVQVAHRMDAPEKQNSFFNSDQNLQKANITLFRIQ